MKYAVIHYAEIGTKGKNRVAFEKLLSNNIKARTGLSDIARSSGQITLSLEKVDLDNLIDTLKRIPGIAYFSIAVKSTHSLDQIKSDTKEFLKDIKFKTFKIDGKRRDKNVPLRSREVNQELGDFIRLELKKEVKLENPDLTIKVEITSKDTFISTKKIQGVGGLPTDPRQKVIALLSGGIDSPVAAYMMMKRGCEVILVHFHNQNQASTQVESKITKLAKQLSNYQQKTKLYIIPFEELQKEIIMHIPSEKRMLIFRKCMIEIASKLSVQNKAHFLVLGDSLSQVASQTVENIEATYSGAKKPILSPLIGLDKNEITDIAREIGTFDLSALPYPDCCSLFVPKHPELRAKAEILHSMMSKIDNKKFEHVLNEAKLVEL